MVFNSNLYLIFNLAFLRYFKGKTKLKECEGITENTRMKWEEFVYE